MATVVPERRDGGRRGGRPHSRKTADAIGGQLPLRFSALPSRSPDDEHPLNHVLGNAKPRGPTANTNSLAHARKKYAANSLAYGRIVFVLNLVCDLVRVCSGFRVHAVSGSGLMRGLRDDFLDIGRRVRL